MKTPLPKKKTAPEAGKESVQWLRDKLFQQKKASQIRPVQFRGTQHRG